MYCPVFVFLATVYTRPWRIPVTSCDSFSPEVQIAVNNLPVLCKLISLQLILKPQDLKNCAPSNDWPSGRD